MIKDFARILKDSREEKGLTQHDVAKRLKYSTPQFISNWERGLSFPPKRSLPKVCKMYGLSTEKMKTLLAVIDHQRVDEYWFGKTKVQ